MKRVLITGAGSYIGTSFVTNTKQSAKYYEICSKEILVNELSRNDL